MVIIRLLNDFKVSIPKPGIICVFDVEKDSWLNINVMKKI